MILDNFLRTFQTYSEKNAFCIDERFYTYGEFLQRINGIRAKVHDSIPCDCQNVGIVVRDSIDAYASIFALWFEGKTYVPLLPGAPLERNRQVVEEAGLTFILDAKVLPQELGVSLFSTKDIPSLSEVKPLCNYEGHRNAYILFTSGSTGKPKGVQITFDNLSNFLDAMWAAGSGLTPDDRSLQMFELTFDFSVAAYTVPLYSGACIYTIPNGEVKYLYIMDLMEYHKLTALWFVPSVIILLRSRFESILSEEVKICSFCGEALPLDVVNEWRKCVPNAIIRNFYGPTEDTVFCTYYDVDDDHQKNHNGAVAIGKSMISGEFIVVGDDSLPVGTNINGELCLAGTQLTPGYWKDSEKNAQAFFSYKGKRFYHTGDMCFMDEDGDLQYVGRMDFQTKINGFRVELSEIEHYASESMKNEHICVCVAYQNAIGATELGLLIQGNEGIDTEGVIDYIRKHLPPYEVPNNIKLLSNLPLNTNGKIDRKAIIKLFENE